MIPAGPVLQLQQAAKVTRRLGLLRSESVLLGRLSKSTAIEAGYEAG
jgi:hypothetical protein